MNVNDIINQIQVNGEIVLNTESGDLVLKKEHFLVDSSQLKDIIAQKMKDLLLLYPLF